MPSPSSPGQTRHSPVVPSRLQLRREGEEGGSGVAGLGDSWETILEKAVLHGQGHRIPQRIS